MQNLLISSDKHGWWYVSYFSRPWEIGEWIYKGGSKEAAEKFLKWYLTS